jgi:hypothetical protein
MQEKKQDEFSSRLELIRTLYIVLRNRVHWGTDRKDIKKQLCALHWFTQLHLSITDIIIETSTFVPNAANPIALKNTATALKFALKIKNAGTAPGTISAVTAGLRNYAATFYFAFADLATAPTATKVAFANTLEPTDLHFTLAVGAVSTATLNFETTGTLPTANCNNYGYICGCISKGAAANFADITTNNCQCKVTTNLISCSSGKHVYILCPFPPNAIYILWQRAFKSSPWPICWQGLARNHAFPVECFSQADVRYWLSMAETSDPVRL